jgi:hypothetical protein
MPTNDPNDRQQMPISLDGKGDIPASELPVGQGRRTAPDDVPLRSPQLPEDALSKLAASAATGRAAYDAFQDAKNRAIGLPPVPSSPDPDVVLQGDLSGYGYRKPLFPWEQASRTAHETSERLQQAAAAGPPKRDESIRSDLERAVEEREAHKQPATTTEKKIETPGAAHSGIDGAVLAVSELLFLLFGLPFGDAIYHDKVTAVHWVYLAIAVTCAIGGPMWPTMRNRWASPRVAASVTNAARDARVWIALLLTFFLYGVAPDIYRRATTPAIVTTRPETGFTQQQVDEKISNAVSHLNSQLTEANRQRDAARREAEAFRQQIQNAPAPTRELDSPRVFTKLTPDQIRAIYEGRTPLQGDILFADEAGKWLATDGKVETVSSGWLILRRDNDSKMVQCAFDNTWRAKLSVLRPNDTVKVVGKLASSHNPSLVILESCELGG